MLLIYNARETMPCEGDRLCHLPVCQEDAYLLELVRYIHLNASRAKVVASLAPLDKYRFCGHNRTCFRIVCYRAPCDFTNRRAAVTCAGPKPGLLLGCKRTWDQRHRSGASAWIVPIRGEPGQAARAKVRRRATGFDRNRKGMKSSALFVQP